MAEKCGYCGNYHGPTCPTVKAIEYHPDGSVKRVEFRTPADYLAPMPSLPVTPGTYGFYRCYMCGKDHPNGMICPNGAVAYSDAYHPSGAQA